MAQTHTSQLIKSVGDLSVNIDSFARHIRAENLSPATLDAYVGAVRAVVEENLAAGYILPYAAERTIREAQASDIGR